MRSGWAWSWVGLALAVSCALPELTIGEGDDGAGDGESGDGGTGLGGSNGGGTAGKGGNAAGGSSGNSAGSSGKGGQGGTDSGGGSGAEGGTGNTGGTDTGGTDTGGASGTDGTGGQGGTTGGNAGSPNGGSGGAGQGGTTAGQGGTTAGQGGPPPPRRHDGGRVAPAAPAKAERQQAKVAPRARAARRRWRGPRRNHRGPRRNHCWHRGQGRHRRQPAVSCPSPSRLFPASGNLGSLDGRLVATPCVNANTDDCTIAGAVYNGLTTPCQSGSLTLQQDFMVGGTPGAMYTVQMRFYGILGPKNYGTSVTRESGTTRPTNSNTGATPAPFAYTNAPGAAITTASDYETNELHVLDQNLQVFRQFFLNSDTQEGHWTYVVNYVKTIPVIGGGRIRMRHFDRNCRQIKNCHNGTGPGHCGAVRVVRPLGQHLERTASTRGTRSARARKRRRRLRPMAARQRAERRLPVAARIRQRSERRLKSVSSTLGPLPGSPGLSSGFGSRRCRYAFSSVSASRFGKPSAT